MSPRESTHEHGRRARSDLQWGFAREWASAIAGTSYTAMSAEALNLFLLRLTDDLLDIVAADVYEGASGRDIGAQLVGAHCTGAPCCAAPTPGPH